jgi:hypothetical protein
MAKHQKKMATAMVMDYRKKKMNEANKKDVSGKKETLQPAMHQNELAMLLDP